MMYKVRLGVKVAKEEGTPDFSFKMKASLNKRIFREGDPVRITVTATQDCYLYIFLITEQNGVYIIYPNQFKKDHKLKKQIAHTYPSEADSVKGLSLKAGLLPGYERAKEALQILATKRPINFSPDLLKEGVELISFNQKSAQIHQLMAEVMTIPVDQRVEAYLAYEIFADE